MSVYYRKDRAAWFFRLRVGGKRINRFGGELKRNAISAEAEYLRLHRPKPPAEDDFFTFVRENYMPELASNVTRESLERTIIVLNKHLVPVFGGPMHEITPGKISDYKLQRLAKVKPDTVRKEMQTLKAILRKARRMGKITVDPSELVKLPAIQPGRLRYISPEEFQSMLQHTPKDYRAALVFALHTGCRRGEVLRLVWPDVDLEAGIASVRDKLGERKVSRLNSTVVALLKGLDRKVDDTRVFWWIRPHNLSRIVRKASLAAGIADFRLHNIRHTTASWLRRAGVELDVIAKILGHKDTRMTERYAHLFDKEIDNAVGILNEKFGGQDGQT